MNIHKHKHLYMSKDLFSIEMAADKDGSTFAQKPTAASYMSFEMEHMKKI